MHGCTQINHISTELQNTPTIASTKKPTLYSCRVHALFCWTRAHVNFCRAERQTGLNRQGKRWLRRQGRATWRVFVSLLPLRDKRILNRASFSYKIGTHQHKHRDYGTSFSFTGKSPIWGTAMVILLPQETHY